MQFLCMSTCVCDFGESKLCLKCYSCKMSEPFLVEDHPKIDNQKTSLEMKSELDNAGVDFVHNDFFLLLM